MALAYLTMRIARIRPFLACALLCVALAAVGCARTRVVGASGSDGSEPEAGAADSTPPKHNSLIAGTGSELLGDTNPILGDIDGDGFDDFLVSAYLPESIDDEQNVVHYLFYGRPEFPERLSTADADASILASVGPVRPLGDITGDGLADFAIQTPRGDIEFVLGDRARKHGQYALYAGGPVWRAPTLPPPFAAGFSTLNAAIGAGDIDCDGIDDVILSAMREAKADEPLEGSVLFGLVHANYVIRGSKSIPSGEWDPRWAVARFGSQFEAEALLSARDLDGDGCQDLVGNVANTVYVYYGGPNVFQADIAPSEADAALQLPAAAGYAPLGDLDGDGFGDLLFQSMEQSQVYVVYGPKQRWSGNVQLTVDLTLQVGAPWFVPVSVEAGDIDGDALPELVIGWSAAIAGDELNPLVTPGAMYAVRSSGTRLRGAYSLGPRDKLQVAPAGPLLPATAPGAIGVGYGAPFSMAGDVDGDGGNDIIAGVPELGEAGGVYIIPSTPRAPD